MLLVEGVNVLWQGPPGNQCRLLEGVGVGDVNRCRIRSYREFGEGAWILTRVDRAFALNVVIVEHKLTAKTNFRFGFACDQHFLQDLSDEVSIPPTNTEVHPTKQDLFGGAGQGLSPIGHGTFYAVLPTFVIDFEVVLVDEVGHEDFVVIRLGHQTSVTVNGTVLIEDF